MNPDKDIFDLIESYLNGSLDSAGIASVEERIRTDKAFAEEVELARQINDLVVIAHFDNVREKMSNDLKNIKHNPGKWKLWGLGITGIGLALCGLLFFNKPETTKQENITTNNTGLSGIESKNEETYKPANKKDVAAEKKQIVTTEENKKEPTEDVKSSSENNIQSFENQDIVKIDKSDESKLNIQPTPPIDCNISFKGTTIATCSGQHNGEVIIDLKSIKGAEAPYQFLLHLESNSTGRFTSLAAGNYEVLLTDANNCQRKEQFTVSYKDCLKRSYNIAPDMGESWTPEGLAPGKGSFTILNRSGSIIFSNEFSDASNITWNGVNRNGEFVEAGLYVCIVEFGNGVKEKFEITVIR